MTPQRINQDSLIDAVQFLTAQDQDLNMIVDQFGNPPLWEREQGFHTLLHIILEQQVSLASAKAAYKKLLTVIRELTPENFLTLTDTDLKSMGFSRQKTLYGRNLASAIVEGDLDLATICHLDDTDAKTQLMKIKGIGAWTADIYLLMAIGRPDIWPIGDMALAIAIQRLKQLPDRPAPEELMEIGRKWRPYRAVAARLLWHYYLKCCK